MTDPALQPGRGASLRRPFSPDFESARHAAAEVRVFLAAHAVGRAELFACELCAAEACNNAVEYAAESAQQPTIEASVGPERIELRVTDHTPGFELPDGPVPPAPAAERGRGLFLIRSLMDEVAYYRGRGRNLLVMGKSRIRPSPPLPNSSSPADELRRELSEYRRTVAGMARELCFRSEMLSAVFRCCAELGRGGDADGFEERLLDDLLHLTSADWYVLRLLAPGDGHLAVAAASEP
ncbi:MAG: ATP-binding protein, partial [Opitutaceae bacterium]